MARFKTGEALLAKGADPLHVEAFFHELLDQGFNFHPDNEGRNYITGGLPGTPSFTDEEADEYDKLMKRAFAVCEYFDRDIYIIGCEMFDAVLTKDEG